MGAIWNAGKIWDNAEVAQNYQNLRDAGYSGPSAGIVGFVGGVGERSFVSRIANAAEGRTAAGDPLSGWQRVGEGMAHPKKSDTQLRKYNPRSSSGRLAMDCSFRRVRLLSSFLVFA